ncbi:unnamed protein product [Didymodactylos carnosus]|uniref:Cytochrome P450 n=1 Tax=Didymodactylos carnosus TaxID=1234261 RepID=A0A814PAT1_9BILA|nr:unnamed protein product [Didymodactylos carnosus]CAF3868372.1 unnamed protein product [Didymodactylos carnosus]
MCYQLANQLIHDRKQDDQDHSFSNDLIKQETLSFIVAGHKTTGNLMSWCIYCLLTNHDALNDCIEKVDRVLNGELPTDESLKHLQVIDSVLHETLRLYPPAPLLGRDCVTDNEIGHGDDKIKIYEGTTFNVNTYALHKYSDYWPNPLKFDYTRWKDSNGERKKLAHSYCYLPFGAGNRACIGQSSALLEARVMLYFRNVAITLDRASSYEMTRKFQK